MTIRKGILLQCMAVIVVALVCIRCSDRQSRTTPPPVAATQPVPDAPKLICVLPRTPPHTFSGAGVQFDYPGDWQVIKSPSALFCIAAPGSGAISLDRPVLNLDVPKLPWHIPGMISCGMVCSGYVDDLRKHQISDAVVQSETNITIAGENARQLTCVGHKNGRQLTDMAVVFVHADRVYIFSADCDLHACDTAGKAMQTAMASVKWIR
jgi:hypothetical protein